MASTIPNDHEAADSFDGTISLLDSRFDTSAKYESAAVNDSSQAISLPARRGRLQGWKFGLTVAATTTILILLCNIAAVIALSPLTRSDGIGTLHGGDCDTTSKLSLGLHLVINVLGSLLLGASNYTMQCLSSPSRQDIDRAHLKGAWLDIGVVGVRNVCGKIPTVRSVVWILLACTSIPIHLLYNSSIFKLNYIYTYQVTVVRPHFLMDGDFVVDATDSFNVSHADIKQTQNWFKSYGTNKSLTLGSSARDCNLNSDAVRTDQGDVLVVLEADIAEEKDTEHQGDLVYYAGYDVNHFFTQWNVTYPENSTAAPIVMFQGHNVSHCLTKLVVPHCVLQSSLHVLATVILCNLIKVCAMVWTLLCVKQTTIVTVGDALASFLTEPDMTTKGRCWLDKRDVVGCSPAARTGPLVPPPRNTGRRAALWEAASAGRWSATGSIGVLLFIVPLYGAYYAQDVLSKGSRGIEGIIAAAMTANAPQLVVSIVYILYNGLFTSMLQACEWNEYYLRKKHLRVSTPRGEQRSTYWLHLPYRYGGPLLAFSMVLHWLISQSLSFTRVGVRKDNGELVDPSAEETSSLGASTQPMNILGLCGLPLFLFVVITAWRKLRWEMPLVGSCSIAISAACHRPAGDLNAAYLPVSWGEVPGEGTKDVGHCSFTSFEVEPVVADRIYA